MGAAHHPGADKLAGHLLPGACGRHLTIPVATGTVKTGAGKPQSHAKRRHVVLRLRELWQRFAPKLRQEDLARALGVPRQRISEWERGTALPSVEQLARLAFLHDVPLELVLDPSWFHEQRARMRALMVERGFPRRHNNENAGDRTHPTGGQASRASSTPL